MTRLFIAQASHASDGRSIAPSRHWTKLRLHDPLRRDHSWSFGGAARTPVGCVRRLRLREPYLSVRFLTPHCRAMCRPHGFQPRNLGPTATSLANRPRRRWTAWATVVLVARVTRRPVAGQARLAVSSCYRERAPRSSHQGTRHCFTSTAPEAPFNSLTAARFYPVLMGFPVRWGRACSFAFANALAATYTPFTAFRSGCGDTTPVLVGTFGAARTATFALRRAFQHASRRRDASRCFLQLA